MYEHVAHDLREQSFYLPRDYTYRLVCEAADAIDQLAALCKRQEVELVELTGQLASKPRWIPVTERLPEKEDLVAFHYAWTGKSGTEYKEITLATLAELKYYGYKPIAWMPLPEPPKEE